MPFFSVFRHRVSATLFTTCLVFPLTSVAQQPSYLPPDSGEILSQYRERCDYVLSQAVTTTSSFDETQGDLFGVAANLDRKTNLEWARKRLRTFNEPPTGNMFWMIPMVLIMQTGRDTLNDDDWAYIRKLWKTYYPYRGDTENHWLMYYTGQYLAAEMFPDDGPEHWFNGKSSAENMDEARSYIEDWIDITISHGQGEFDSPNYADVYIRPLLLLTGWVKDPSFRHKARMILDYILLDYAVESLDGFYGGAHSRVYPRHVIVPSLNAINPLGWLFFGQGEYRYNATHIIAVLSGYTPPTILFHIANDRTKPYIQRELKRTRWRLRNAGPNSFEVKGKRTVPVYKYSYVDSDFILGSCQGGLLQPIQQQTWSLIWRGPTGSSNTFFGLQPHSSPFEGSMYFGEDPDTVTDLIARSKVDYDSEDKLQGGSPYEQVFQHETALIALYDIPKDARFPLIHTFFSRDLKQREEDSSGWIFAQGGPVYIAYRPFAPGEWKPVDWTGLLKSGAGGFVSTGFAALSEGSQSYASYERQNGYIVQIAPSREHDSFESFKTAVKALPLEFSLSPTPSATFTSLDGSELQVSYGKPPSINGNDVEYSSWKLFDGPFSQSERGSKRLEMQYDRERYILDFNTVTIEETIIPSR